MDHDEDPPVLRPAANLRIESQRREADRIRALRTNVIRAIEVKHRETLSSPSGGDGRRYIDVSRDGLPKALIDELHASGYAVTYVPSSMDEDAYYTISWESLTTCNAMSDTTPPM